MNRRSSIRRAALTAAAPLLLAISGCGSDDSSGPATAPGLAGAVTCSAPDGAKGPGAGTKAVGFVYAGSKTDLGYNQAIHAGAVALRDACSKIDVLESDAIADAAGMTAAAERMIGEDAKVVFSTSPAYAKAAVALAKQHPDVVVLQQGAVVDKPLPPNLGTYDGSADEPSYLAGIAAATATKSNKLGWVTASARPRALANLNAFTLGALSVDPKIRTHVRFVGSSCNPAAQRRAALSLLSKGIDVLAQEQDCTATVIKAAEADGKYSVGFHFDARAIAPMGWLTGVESDWAPLFGAVLSSVQKGTFAKGEFHGNLVVGFSSTKIPPAMRLARYGPAIDVNAAQRISNARARIIQGHSPFSGPIVDRSGNVRIARGKSASRRQLATMSYVVRGVLGSLPQ
ncbi:MAG: basic rane protein [bacterium]|jgi:simple sugar transport system substrate-binding protein/basic membrane protein A